MSFALQAVFALVGAQLPGSSRRAAVKPEPAMLGPLGSIV